MENPFDPVATSQQCGGAWLKQTIRSRLCCNCMHGWRVILRLHTAMSRKSEKRKEGEGDLGFMVCGGASVTWEWIGVMTLFLSSSWVHLYIHLCGGRAIHLSEPPQMEHSEKGTNRQIDKTLSRVESALLLTLWYVLYVSGFVIVFRWNLGLPQDHPGFWVSLSARPQETILISEERPPGRTRIRE